MTPFLSAEYTHIVRRLRRVALCAELDDAALADVARLARPLVYARGAPPRACKGGGLHLSDRGGMVAPVPPVASRPPGDVGSRE